jgi:hypothetical protein
MRLAPPDYWMGRSMAALVVRVAPRLLPPIALPVVLLPFWQDRFYCS